MVQILTPIDHRNTRSWLLVRSTPKTLIREQEMLLLQLNHMYEFLGM